MIEPGKLNILIDGQFGSTGKGLFANYIGVTNHIDVAISNASSNAGHTFFIGSRKIIVKHLPVSGILNRRSVIYICAGAIIDPVILLKEIEENDIDPNRIIIHPRAAIIEPDDIALERFNNDGVKQIASTMSGVGAALVRKINRVASLAQDHKLLEQYIGILDMHYLLKQGCNALMEVPQGMDLSLNHGYAYPYCTSRDITPAAALNDAGVHPKFLGNVMVSIRTFPIRVGNVIENGKELGYSGPFYEDSIETTWDKLRIKKEYTTRTKRVRRVASFSIKQYNKMLNMMQPNYILLNFCNYLSPRKLDKLLTKLPEITHLGFGPTIDDIRIR